mgnify:CR=1 FL=1
MIKLGFYGTYGVGRTLLCEGDNMDDRLSGLNFFYVRAQLSSWGLIPDEDRERILQEVDAARQDPPNLEEEDPQGTKASISDGDLKRILGELQGPFNQMWDDWIRATAEMGGYDLDSL